VQSSSNGECTIDTILTSVVGEKPEYLPGPFRDIVAKKSGSTEDVLKLMCSEIHDDKGSLRLL
jgi:hypothetical protein